MCCGSFVGLAGKFTCKNAEAISAICSFFGQGPTIELACLMQPLLIAGTKSNILEGRLATFINATSNTMRNLEVKSAPYLIETWKDAICFTRFVQSDDITDVASFIRNAGFPIS